MKETSALFTLSIDPLTKTQLTETTRWARLLAVAGFVFILLLVFIGVYSSLTISRYEDMFNGYTGRRTFMESLGVGAAITYIVLAVIAFFPFLFVLRFATAMRNALAANNQASLNDSFHYLKLYFRYLGIVLIVCLVVIVLSILMGILSRAI
jgi:uncharacterized membrane protein YjgN (DUF898 family)